MRAAGCECWQQEVIRAHTLPHLAAEITGRLESPAGPPCFETMMHNNRMGGLLPAPPPPLRLTHAVTCLSPERPPPPPSYRESVTLPMRPFLPCPPAARPAMSLSAAASLTLISIFPAHVRRTIRQRYTRYGSPAVKTQALFRLIAMVMAAVIRIQRMPTGKEVAADRTKCCS